MNTSLFELVKEKNGYRLYRRSDGRWTVVYYSAIQNQVYSAMPGDMPENGGRFFAGPSDYGIYYVSHGYSESYARRVFRKLTKEAELYLI